ncbi:hypothetical protein [Adhaeretor mobilis]|uniref:hypothetical protein n=1 Tax=Adhaeretor mobilis TaxID=1930276 RepID=UPI0011A383A2|nr:hypothetical protein [Adhaeretor mobilis]
MRSSIGFLFSLTLCLPLVAQIPQQSQPVKDRAVQPATATSVVPQQRPIRFALRAARIGDRVQQRVGVEMQLKTLITQSGQTAHESDTTMRRQQQRLVEVTAVEGENFKAARVEFPLSRMQVPKELDPESAVADVLAPQPIEGKVYLVTRVDGKLKITDASGELPPVEEYKLVADSLATLGKPNLLARHLLKVQPQVGQRVLVPREIAKSLFGMNDDIGAIKRFELTLSELKAAPAGGFPLAVFMAKIETMPSETSPMEMSVEGKLTMEISTCRIVAAELAGPIGMSSEQQTAEGFFHYGVSGQLRMATSATYR